MKNNFYFTLKAVFVLKYFIILSSHFGHVEEIWLDQKDKINFKIDGVTIWLRNNCKHILTNISISPGIQALKFGQLIKHNMRNFFFEKACTKYGGKTFPRPFPKKSKLNIFLKNSLKF